MRQFKLTILGCSSATPTSKRHPTSQLLTIEGRLFLIDCGEATQIQLRKYKVKFQRIDHIFISHLHGDHYLGLMGLLSSMHLLGRTDELNLYCQAELKEIIDIQLKYSKTRLSYPIIYHNLRYDETEVLFEDDLLTVETIILNHRIPTCGFLFREKSPARPIHKEKIIEYNIPIKDISAIKSGEDFVMENGTVIPNNELTSDPIPARSYAFCSDTKYDETVIEKVKEVDLLYHEATFMNDRLERAKETYHSTTIQAGSVALKAGVKKLLIGHYSARYKELEPLLLETKSVFENSFLSIEGEEYDI